MTRRTLIICLAALFALLVTAFVIVATDTPPQAATETLQVPPNMGGPFTLTNQDGVKQSTASFKGQYKLLYFGFTHCPAICPTELQTIARSMELLGPDAGRVQPLFVTVDPERDTAKVMKDYVGLFSMKLVGFTGTKAEIAAVEKQYRIYASKVQDESSSDYSVDHSSFVYLLDENDKVIDLFKADDTPEVIANRVKSFVSKP